MTTPPPKYWIIVASRDHVMRGVAGGFAQANHGKAAPLKRLRPGDFIVFYSSKLEYDKKSPYKKFTAVARVKAGDAYPGEMRAGVVPFRSLLESPFPILHHLQKHQKIIAG